MAAQGTPDQDAYTTPFMLTKAMHRDVYPAVDPVHNPAVKAEGKVIVITGATGGLGFAIARSFLAAGARGVVLVGRNKETLETAHAELDDGTGDKVLPVVANIVLQKEADRVFKQTVDKFGHVDVLINAAGIMKTGPIGTLSSDDWWENFEANVRVVFNTSHSFINVTGGKGGTIVNLVSLGASFLAPGMSGYSASKLALIKLGESLDLEQPNLRVFSVHPGIVEAENGRGAEVEAFLPFAKDKAALTGGVSVYLTTPRADFLRGGYVSVNWDVEELEAHKGEIVDKKLVKLGFLNGQFRPGGYQWSS